MEIQDMQKKIQAILDQALPESFFKEVRLRKILGSKSISIMASPGSTNGERFRHEMVSLSLDFYERYPIQLRPQVFGGYGGQSFIAKAEPGSKAYRLGNYDSVIIPFRKPKSEEKAILRAVERFFKRYLQALKDNAHRLIDLEKMDCDFLDNIKIEIEGVLKDCEIVHRSPNGKEAEVRYYDDEDGEKYINIQLN